MAADLPAERGPSGTGHDTACPECGTPGAAYGTHVCYAGSVVSRPAEPRVTEAAPAPEDVYYEREMLRAAAAFFDAGQYEDMEDVLREALRLPPVAVPVPASAPADPVVSPADTIRQALTADTVEQYEVAPGTLALIPGSAERVPRHQIDREALAALAALLAVGERDKAEIAELRDRLEVVSGNVYLWQVGELAARDALNAIVADSESRRTALISQRERDRRQIARLTEALETLLRFARPVDIDAALVQGGVDVRAVLAGEEDAATPEPICPGCKRPVSECRAEDVDEGATHG